MQLFGRTSRIRVLSLLLSGAMATSVVVPLGGPLAAVAAPVPSATSNFDSEFPLVSGDVISVQVANHEDFSGQHVVSGAGKITLPYTGTLTVVGKTLAEVQRLVTGAFKSQLKRPSVSVTMLNAKPRSAQVLGQVGSPGPVSLRRGWRVSEVLAAAGGLNGEIEDVTATLKRGAAAPIALDVKQILSRPEAPANVAVRPGDVLSFAARPVVRVTVSGDIATPGQLKLRQNARLLDAVVGAGGLGAFRPSEMRATLIRGGNPQPLDLDALFGPNPETANLPLRDGDLLSFSGKELTVSVVSLDNLVAKPGSFKLRGDVTALTALLEAGNLTVPTNRAVVSVRRGGESIPVDLERAAVDPSADVPLRNGDVLLVAAPEGPRVIINGDVTTPGPMILRKNATLLDAMIQAQLKLTPAETEITVLRTGENGRQTPLRADARLLLEARDLSQNLRLQDGDTILVNPVTKTLQTVFLNGQVEKPGEYQVEKGEGVVELLLRGGGASEMAALSEIVIERRGGERQVVDLSSAFRGGTVPRVELAPNDIVTVPENKNQVLVLAAVQQPGYVAVPEGEVLTLGDALIKVGGPKDRAKLKQVAILRRRGDKVERRIVDVSNVAKGQLTIAEPLQAGDVVWVPEGGVARPPVWSSISQVLGIAGAASGLFGF